MTYKKMGHQIIIWTSTKNLRDGPDVSISKELGNLNLIIESKITCFSLLLFDNKI
jgi:hypothetical protein